MGYRRRRRWSAGAKQKRAVERGLYRCRIEGASIATQRGIRAVQ